MCRWRNASRTFALPFALVLLVRPSWDAFLTSAAEVPDTSRRHAVGLATLVALRTEPAKAAGAATQILASKDALDKLRADECWTRVDCNGDDIRRVAGTVGTVSPLFKIKDALMEVYMEEPSGAFNVVLRRRMCSNTYLNLITRRIAPSSQSMVALRASESSWRKHLQRWTYV
ncbi:unnamed protein product [Durusdinium trenchii]|uniref:Uncharacterized protein n=1 Tax=Durusdinium trenchii TaxID=1381693 RepID=A0ABP0LFU6_9DINO